MPGVKLLCVKTDKFKTGYFSVSLIRQLSRDNAAKDCIIPRVLRRGTRRYPDMESISAALDNLYGAVVEPVMRQRGEVLSVGFAASFVDGKYLPGNEDTLKEALSITADFLLEPASVDGLLRADYVNSEKKVLIDDIRSCINDKKAYAVRRLRETMCSDEAYSAYSYGSIETAEAINNQSLTSYYKEMLRESEIFMFYCGSADYSEVELSIKEAFSVLPRAELFEPVGTEIRINAKEPKYITEEADVRQGNLAIGFRLGKTMYSPNYAALTVFNTIYGGGVSSKLFENVREKLSLCYYASSSIDSHKGIMSVSSGIKTENYQKAIDEILAQLDACRKGSISPRELETAKSHVIASLEACNDSPSVLDDFYLGQELRDLNYNLDDYIGLVEFTTQEDIIRIAESIELDTVYFLKNRGGSAEE